MQRSWAPFSLIAIATAVNALAAAVAPSPVLTEGPWLTEQLSRDRRCGRPLLDAWGESLNWDANAKAQIVETSTIQRLHRALGLQLPPAPRVHAGTEHVYGYLFSKLLTPYGYKRDRWLSGESERALGLPDHTFDPLQIRDGSLLGAVTWVLGSVALPEPPTRCSAPKALRSWKLSLPIVGRIQEEAVLNGHRWILRTTLLERFLIYTAQQDTGPERVVTGFPIQPGLAHSLLDHAQRTPRDRVLARYNVSIPGWPAAGVDGKVRVQ